MKEKMTRILSLLLCVSLILCLAACGGAGQTDMTGDQAGINNTSEPDVTQTENTEPPKVEQISDENGKLRYVMIYNPKVYKESASFGNNLSTGDFGMQVDTSMAKADGLEMPTDYPFNPWNQTDIDPDIPLDELNLDGDRADTMITPYSVGNSKTFYCFDSSMNRTSKEFTCLYTGSYCNIWSYDPQFNSYAAEIYGKAFDEKIYPQMLDSFGTARFAENGGKVNLLFYPMTDGLAGCFTNADLYSSSEVPTELAGLYGMNTDHAILNINSAYAIYVELVDLMCSTMAHEFQHLICATDSTYALNGEYCSTWLNEAMSGYVEEMLYPGAKETSGHYEAFAMSDRIRYGQSLYNFETDNTDIGVYGSVYLFSEYLAGLTNQGTTFRNFHDSWRNSYSMTICDSEGLYSIMPQNVIDEISGTIDFSDSVVFESEKEEWMSKLTLAFYMSLLANDPTAPSAYSNVDPLTLLYDEINPANIEGGGRVIIAVKDSVFNIPEDADDGLVYVGLDENFQPITSFITN